jgi:hypothetical protein
VKDFLLGTILQLTTTGHIPEPPINPPDPAPGVEEQNTIREILADALEKLAGLNGCLEELKYYDEEGYWAYFDEINQKQSRSRLDYLGFLKSDLLAWQEEMEDV